MAENNRRATGAEAGRTASATGHAAGAARGPRSGAGRSTTGPGASTSRQRRDPAETSAAHGSSQNGVCPVAFCPICTAVSAINRASPDVVQHLLLAGQQFLMALKAVVDARAADFEEDDAGEPPMQRVDIG